MPSNFAKQNLVSLIQSIIEYDAIFENSSDREVTVKKFTKIYARVTHYTIKQDVFDYQLGLTSCTSVCMHVCMYYLKVYAVTRPQGL